VHGMAGTAWFALFVTQVVLAARGKLQWHRQLGIVGVGIAVVLLVSGVQSTYVFTQKLAAQGNLVATNGSGPAFVHWAIAVSYGGLLAFTGTVAVAIACRRRRDVHSRLMLLATAGLLGPAVSRVVGWFQPLPSPFMAVLTVFLITMIVYDIRTRGRPHIATVLGGLWMYGVITAFMAFGVGERVLQHAMR
jgi:ABC-type Na+ efflux pump permease subunit